MHDKKERILNATEHLLAKHGFSGLSMSMIAKEAGVATGTLYTHFTDKDGLLSNLYAHALKVVADCMQQDLDFSQTLQTVHQQMWMNLWTMTANRTEPMINHCQFANLPRPFKCEEQTALFTQVSAFFDTGKSQRTFKDLPNTVLFALAFEPAMSLGRKHNLQQLTLNSDELNTVIAASWDAISLHQLEHLDK